MRDWLKAHSSLYAARHRDTDPRDDLAPPAPARAAVPDHPAHPRGELHRIGSVNVNGKSFELFCDGSEKLL